MPTIAVSIRFMDTLLVSRFSFDAGRSYRLAFRLGQLVIPIDLSTSNLELETRNEKRETIHFTLAAINGFLSAGFTSP
jgi:hypothetical protein